MSPHDAAWSRAVQAQAREILASWSEPGPASSVPVIDRAELARYIDHTLLKADATPDAVIKLCAEAAEHGFAAVCVNSCHVPLCAEQLRGAVVAVGSVVGFPLGANLTAAKVAEA